MNTIEKITVRENKTLKLNNVLIREVSQNEIIDINKVGYMMDSYIKSKGNSTIGPMINYSAMEMGENGQHKIILKLMVQLKNPIHNIEKPYELKTQIRIANCLFARFSEKEENLRHAYSKLGVYAFENDIKLKGDNYTVFVENKEGKVIADVFMEVQKEALMLEGV
jgi:effector-binding domain-containing protein